MTGGGARGPLSRGWRSECRRSALCFCVFILSFSVGACRRQVSADTWGVIFTSLPKRISFDNIDEPVVAYIFRQTHEPLLRIEDGDNFSSRVLSKWRRSLDYSEYSFWPDTSLRFSNGERFSVEYLSAFLQRVTPRYSDGFQIVAAETGIVVKFNRSRPGYLDFLSQYRNSPSRRINEKEEGLGAYLLSENSASRVLLIRKIPVSDGYNKIAIYPYSGPTDTNLRSRGVSDFNHLSSFQQPDWIKREFHAFDNIELRVVSLAINHPDRDMRRALYGCIDFDEFRRAAIPARKDFYDISTLIPIGIPGAKSGGPHQVCNVPKRLKGREISFANPRSDNQAELNAYVEKFNAKTGLKLKVKSFRPDEMNPILMRFNEPKPFNLVIAVSQPTNGEPADFFRLYADKVRVVDDVPPRISELFGFLGKEEMPGKKREVSALLADAIADEGLAIPLYQTVVKLYYPRRIKNLAVGQGFLGVPNVADLKW